MALSASYDVDIAIEYGLPAAALLNKLVFLCRHTPREDGWCWRTAQELQDEIGIGPKALRNAINVLTKAGIIEVKNTYIVRTQTKCRHFFITNYGYEKLHLGKCDCAERDKSEVGERDKSLYIGSNQIGVINNNDLPQAQENDDFCKEVIDHLNAKIGSHYKPTSLKTKKLIKARRDEGFTLEDFKTVIDKKCESWLSDPEMSRYLRPETLFGTKFESYLNEVHATKTYFTADTPSEGGEGWLNKADLKAWGMQ